MRKSIHQRPLLSPRPRVVCHLLTSLFLHRFFLFLQLLICLYNRHKIPRFYIKVKRDGSVGAIHLIINSSSADNCMYLDFYTTTIWTSFVSTLLSDAAQSSKTLDINRSSWPPYIDYCRPTPKSIIILIHDAGLFSSYSNLCWKVQSKNPTLLSFWSRFSRIQWPASERPSSEREIEVRVAAQLNSQKRQQSDLDSFVRNSIENNNDIYCECIELIGRATLRTPATEKRKNSRAREIEKKDLYFGTKEIRRKGNII